jgi:hypothetical protein
MHVILSDKDLRRIQSLAYVALGGTACFVICTLVLHIVQPELSPLNEAMSYYVHGKHGWLLTTALLAIGAGSLSLTVALATILRGWTARVGIGLLAIWSVGAILGGVFAADPPGNWDQPPSLSGAIHGVAALVALTAFPLAAAMIAASWRSNQAKSLVGGLLRLFAFGSVISFIAFAASLVPVVFRPGPPVLFGLTERILLAVYVAWICVAAVGLLFNREESAS